MKKSHCPKKCVLMLLDGLGDRAYQILDYQTPLQAARTPKMDKLAGMGANGLYHAAEMGQALPSENAHFAMFGYDMADFPGRGALEALGAGVALQPDEVAVLVHFAGVREKNGYLVLEDGKLQGMDKKTDKEVEALLDAVGEYETDGVSIRFHRTYGFFGILILQGQVSPYVTDSDPITDGYVLSAITPWQSHAADPAAQHTAKVLTRYLLWVYEQLKKHPMNISRKQKCLPPANIMVTQRPGKLKPVAPFSECYGLRGMCMASGVVYKGLSDYIGLDFSKETDTKDPGADMAVRLKKAHDLLDTYDFIHVHSKAPDEAAHAKDPLFKKSVIESLDAGIGKAVKPLLENPDVVVVLTADHSTPSSGPLVHSGEPVPLTICGEGLRRDRVRHFNEIEAATGALGNVRGRELMYLILNYLDYAKLHGIMDTPVDQPFWHGEYEPFRIA